MKTVICSLPNASTNISGIAFERLDDGRVQASVTNEQAALFDGIGGYEIADTGTDKVNDKADKGGKRGVKPEAGGAL